MKLCPSAPGPDRTWLIASTVLRRTIFVVAITALGIAGPMGLSLAQDQPQDQPQAEEEPQDQAAQASTGLTALMRDDSNWVMAPKDYANTRFSGLDQINTGNADELQLAWTISLGAARGQEAAPLVVDGIMFVVGPYAGPHPNRVFALNAATGDIIWTYTPRPNFSAMGVACCDVVNRGLAYDDGKVFLATLDMHAVAIDAKTGKEVWVTKLGDINRGETMTMAPMVVKDKVLFGNSGGELGVRGWLTALNEDTGDIVWRAYSTGPDEDVLIGEDFEPYYDWMKGENLGVKTWPPEAWKIGGGTVWGWISYDPERDLIYYGTANPGPWNANQRPGDNMWTTTIFARDPDTGMAKWAYQVNPHDLWDYDEINENILIDGMQVNGEEHDVLVHVARNGYMYVIDRTNGQVLSAEPYDTVNSIIDFNLETGRHKKNPELKPEVGKTVVGICPAAPGAKDWQPSAYSLRTGLIYVPHQHLCMNWRSSEVGYIAGTPYVGATVDMYATPGDNYRGEFMAWDPVEQKKVWAIREQFPVWSGALVTAGDVAFYGTMDRWFKAVDANTGRVLWQTRTPSGIIGQPVTYSAGGTQYVAILSGVGGWPGVVANAEIDPRVRNGALGFVGAMQDLPLYTAGGSTLMVFALPRNRQPAEGREEASAPAAAEEGQASAPPAAPQGAEEGATEGAQEAPK